MKSRFTLDGSDELEALLARTCDRAAEEIRRIIPADLLEAVVLGGGYGRGEGGVLRTPAGDRPYNDLEFYVCVRGNPRWNERRFGAKLAAVAVELSDSILIEVEFKITSVFQLEHGATTMFVYDLVEGHRVISGDGGILQHCEHHRNPRRIPLSEATRLLMNRCSGLLFAKDRLERWAWTDADADFVRRNLAKAELGFGDAVLTVFGKYHWSCRRRNELIEKLEPQDSVPWLTELRRLHASGVEFKLHPARVTKEARPALEERWKELARLGRQFWLWIESRRLGQRFASPESYARSSINKCPETGAIKNLMINANLVRARFGPGPGLLRYPRERLFNGLSLLLWTPDALYNPSLVLYLHRNLGHFQDRFASAVEAYSRLWSRYN